MRTWLFQSNPRVYDIDTYLRNNKLIRWVVRRYKDEITPGDEAFIWRADGGKSGSGGVVARGVIVSKPELKECDAPDLWVDNSHVGEELRVKIELEEVRLTPEDGMLTREELQRDENLKDM